MLEKLVVAPIALRCYTRDSMRKKYTIAPVTGVVISLILYTLGFSTCYSTSETSTPLFAFASDRSGAGDIFVFDQAGQIRNLTNHPSADWDPAWSPEGTTLAFTSHRSGDSDIWLLDTAPIEEELHPRNLTNDPAWDYSPTWSPSGQSVAFISEQDGDPEILVQNLAYLINDLGFNWARGYVNWGTVEPEPGQFNWTDPDNVVNAFGDQQVKIWVTKHHRELEERYGQPILIEDAASDIERQHQPNLLHRSWWAFRCWLRRL